MANSWFRMYGEFLNDPKVQMLSEVNQRRLIMVFFFFFNGHVTLQDEEVAFQLRISNEEWLATKAVFVSKGMLTEGNEVVNWDKRQFVSDSSAARVAKHRAAKKLVCNVTVTPPDTDTDTDTESTSFAAQQSEPVEDDPPPDAPPLAAPTKRLKGSVSPRGTRLPEDWVLPKQWGEWALSETSLTAPAVRLEAAKFGDYWRAKAGREAVKLDWQATWRNWVRTAADRAQGSAKSYPNSAVGTAVFGGAV